MGPVVGGTLCLIIVPLVHFSVPFLLLGELLVLYPLYAKFLNEKVTFEFIKGVCPNCKKPVEMKPFMNRELKDEVTVYCTECGQNSRAHS